MKVALITGTSRGVGRATAVALGACGFRVHMMGRSSAEQRETERQLNALAVPFAFEACELTDGKAIEEAAASLLELHGAPEVVVHNAGVVKRAPLSSMTDEVWQHQLDVNLTAPFRLTRALLPAMLDAGRGRFLFVSSISAVVGSRHQAAYNASKAGLVALMRCLAEELSGTGLMTAAVLPGAIDTDMLHGSGYAPQMSADEVARTLAFLATDASVAHNGGITEMFGI